MAEEMKDDLFVDEPYDASLFEDEEFDAPEQTQDFVTAPATPNQQKASELERLLKSAAIGGGIYGAQRATEEAAPLVGKAASAMQEKVLDPLAENLAFQSIGGKSTKEGKELLQKAAEQMGEDAPFITPRDVGRQVLDKNLKKSLPFSTPTVGRTKKALSEAIETKGKLVSDIDKQYGKIGDLSNVSEDIISGVKRDLPTDLDVAPGSKDVVEKLMKEARERNIEMKPMTVQYKELQDVPDEYGVPVKRAVDKTKEVQVPTKRMGTISDLEKSKNLEKFVDEAKSPAQKLKNIEYGAYRREAERAIKQQSPELLEEFVKAKKGVGATKIANEIAKKKFYKDIGDTTYITPGHAISKGINKGINEAKGIAAKVLDSPNKFKESVLAGKAGKQLKKLSKLGKGVWKSLPVLGAFATYSEAKAQGMSEEDALSYTAANEGVEAIPIVGQIKMALEPARGGANFGTIEHKLQSGEPLSDQEKEYLKNKQQASREAAEQYKDFQPVLDSPGNIADVQAQYLAPLKTAMENKYGQDNPHVQTLERLINTDDRQLQRTLKFKLSSDPSFRQMVNSFDTEEK